MNKNYLLDTHIFVWWMTSSPELSLKVNKLISDSENAIYLSIASIWEMSIKIGIGKLKLPKDWKETFGKGKFLILPIELPHVCAITNLPLIHKDPFDRMLVAQAITEKMTLITADANIKKYKVPVLD